MATPLILFSLNFHDSCVFSDLIIANGRDIFIHFLCLISFFSTGAVVPYEITVYTSDLFAAGTDADVYVVLYGANGICTQKKFLCQNKRERRMYFERNAVNQFIVEVTIKDDVKV